MPISKKDNIESLSLRLKTPESAADAAAVASMLRAIVVLVDEVKNQIAEDAEVSIRVRPFEEGSLQIPFDLIIKVKDTILFGVMPILPGFIETIKNSFELIKLFKGGPVLPPGQDKVTITNNFVIHGGRPVFNTITAPQVQSALNQSALDLENDEAITGFQLFNDTTGEELVNVSREEFSYFRSNVSLQEVNPPPERMRKVTALLTVRSPDLQGRRKWSFNYEGTQISASMSDNDFIEKVVGGEVKFAAGDRLEVELEIGEKFVPAMSDYERNKKYNVVKVKRHIVHVKQQVLFSNDEIRTSPPQLRSRET